MTNDRDVDEWMQKPWPVPRAQRMLLSRGTRFTDMSAQGELFESRAAGYGIILILGTSGSGKSTLAHSMIHWASMRCDRPLCYMGFSKEWIEVLPEFMRERATVLESLDELQHVPHGAILLLDDTGIWAAARRAASKVNVKLSKFAQVARHLDVTIVVTAQAVRAIDFASAMVAETTTLVKWFSNKGVFYENPHWGVRIQGAQQELFAAAGSRTAEACRPYYWCDDTNQLGMFPVPEWVFDDMVSRPIGKLTPEQLGAILE